MGALIAYEVTRRLFREGRAEVAHLLVSGRAAPQLPFRKRRWDLPEPEFVQALRELGGFSDEVLNDPELMDAATVLGACGTAFAMRYIRANIQGGIEIGFDAATASLIAAQTVKGAAELLLKKQTHPEQEIDKVTTPKGCTIAGLNEMEHRGFSSSLIKGLVASYQKIGQD